MNTKQYTIRLKRTDFLSDRIKGNLLCKTIDGNNRYFATLEPIEKPLFGCVPKGIYRIIKRYSPKFKKSMYYLAYVHGRSGIMFHAGNFPKDTKGCILLGLYRGNDIDNLVCSTQAVHEFMDTLDFYSAKGYNIDLVIE